MNNEIITKSRLGSQPWSNYRSLSGSRPNKGCNPNRKSNAITTRVATLIEWIRNYNEGCNPDRRSNEITTRVLTLIEKATILIKALNKEIFGFERVRQMWEIWYWRVCARDIWFDTGLNSEISGFRSGRQRYEMWYWVVCIRKYMIWYRIE